MILLSLLRYTITYRGFFMKKWSEKFIIFKYIVIFSALQLMFINCGGEFKSNQLNSYSTLNSDNISEQNGSAPISSNDEEPSVIAEPTNKTPVVPILPIEEEILKLCLLYTSPSPRDS